ncbi:hypothetical protein D0T84_21385 [Dysgonomonas sp. 521]|uniref:hypothetical protein n=1 Tax=Dysgonomonas sp. 521 TaxID=2302932 RepID=UPI0013D4019C|nr:hypothetical protein [Dysgonomonas sp. 521]NDV97430.1 hypothetical protein [Dysgonomonas sp. 521]
MKGGELGKKDYLKQFYFINFLKTKHMKQLKKISLDGFDELSTQEAAQLLGGQDPVRSDSTYVARTDSTKTSGSKIIHKITGSSVYNTQNGSSSHSVGYSGSYGNFNLGVNYNYNTMSGSSIQFTGSYTFGKK